MATEATTDKKGLRNKEQASRRRRPRGATFSGRFPWWGVLLGCLMAVVAYVSVLYFVFVGPLSFRWRAIFGEPDYPDGYEVRGIDISHYQEDVEWERLSLSTVNDLPLSFVIVKATEGMSLMDKNFDNNFFEVREMGVIRGAYHFFIPDGDARMQAEFYLRQVQLEAGDLPPILDIEKRGERTLQEFQSDVRTWLDIVEQSYGVAPIIYTNLDFRRKYLNDDAFGRYPLWIANYYKKELKYDGKWALWQYTDLGKVEGIRHNVDFDLFNGSMSDLQQLLIPMDTDTMP